MLTIGAVSRLRGAEACRKWREERRVRIAHACVALTLQFTMEHVNNGK